MLSEQSLMVFHAAQAAKADLRYAAGRRVTARGAAERAERAEAERAAERALAAAMAALSADSAAKSAYYADAD